MFRKFKSLLISQTSKDTFYSLLGNTGIVLGGMLFTILAARSLSPAQFGIFSALIALSTIASLIGDLGTSSSLVNFLPKHPQSRRNIVSTIFWLELLAALVLGTTLLILSPFNGILIPGSTRFQFILAAFLAGLYVLNSFNQALFKAEKKFLRTSILQVFDSSAKLLIITSFFIRGGLTLEIALLATVISELLTTIIGLSTEIKNITLKIETHFFRPLFSFTKWISLSQIFAVAIGRIDTLLLVSLSSAFQAGIYSAGSRITLVFSLLISSLGSVIAPRFSQFTTTSQVVTYLRKVSLMVLLLTVLLLSSIFFAAPIINIVFGEKYQLAIPVFKYLVLSMVPFLFTVITVSPLIYFFNKPDFIAKTTILQVFLLVLLDITLIPRFGALAPAISLGVSNTVTLILTAWKLNQVLAHEKA